MACSKLSLRSTCTDGLAATPAIDFTLEEFVDAPNPNHGGAVMPSGIFTFDQAQRSLLERSQGNQSLAARMLGISRKQLYAKLRKFGL